MKKLYKLSIFILLVFSIHSALAEAEANTCSWSTRGPYYAFWDSCSGHYALNGYIGFNYPQTGCFKYKWTVNGVVVGTGRTVNYHITQNGTYNLCVNVTDTCNNCDTAFCSTRVITCIPNTCNWANLYTSFWDSCTNTKKATYGYASLNTCYKYQWTVNNVVAGTDRIFSYNITQNGPYTVCLHVSDTCTHCDTTICSTRTFTCISGPCNWSSRNPYYAFWDSCSGHYKLNGYIGFNYAQTGCFKYQWKVNGVLVGTGRSINYPITQNGTYNLCISVIDTCNGCDTTFCSTRVITCIPAACNWSTLHTAFWDSCSNTKRAAYAYASLNTCYKYQWTVNNVAAGTDRIFSYNIPQNGSYTVCLHVSDTCTHCDTTICSTRTFTCIPTTCNWSDRHPYTAFWDSCNGHYKLNGYIGFNYTPAACFKYQWKVNGVLVGTDRTISYPISQNGTYNLCLTVTDTCYHCDTTFCSTRVITCIPTACNWSSRYPYISFWDSCVNGRKGVNGYITFNSNMNCFKFQWTVNGQVVGTNRWLNYPLTQNGTYVVCVKVTDTCSHCDTTFCSTRVLNCLPPPNCNWSSRNAYVSFWDSCNSRIKALNGYIYFPNLTTNCFSYQWKVNGVAVGTGRVLNYPVTQNGTYTVCVSVIDSCNHCDTSYCSTRVISCNSITPCNWSGRYPYTAFWDSCTGHYKLNGYIGFNYAQTGCFKYQWKLNGVVVGSGRTLSYPINQNGTYNLCVTVTDTCNHCDTTFCSTRVITCIPTNAPCNWKARNPYVYFWDSCSLQQHALHGYITFNSNSSCFKYQWKVNGVNAGTDRTLNYPLSQNGTYTVCVTVTDTCNHCDTSFCSTRSITCIGDVCNWHNEHPFSYFVDSCYGDVNRYSVNGFISFNSTRLACFLYAWKVNGNPAGTGHSMSYPISQNGTYTVCVTVYDSCRRCDTTYCNTRTITCVQLQGNTDSPELQVYPNPASGLLNIYYSGDDAPYTLTDLSGQVLVSGNLKKGNQLLDVSALASDMYLLRIQTGSKVINKKIILKN